MKRRLDLDKRPTYREAAALADEYRAFKPEGEFQVRKRKGGFAVVERFVIDGTA